jgi:hypothetical protein
LTIVHIFLTMAQANLHLKRQYYRLALQILTENEEALDKFDKAYKGTKTRLYDKIFFANVNQDDAKRKKLLKRLDKLSKVSLFFVNLNTR